MVFIYRNALNVNIYHFRKIEYFKKKNRVPTYSKLYYDQIIYLQSNVFIIQFIKATVAYVTDIHYQYSAIRCGFEIFKRHLCYFSQKCCQNHYFQVKVLHLDI